LSDENKSEKVPKIDTTGPVNAIQFSPSGDSLAVAYLNLPAALWNVGDYEEVRLFRGRNKGAYSLAFSPDGKTLATTILGTDEVVLWQVSTGDELLALNPKVASGLNGVAAFSPDGRTLAVGGIDADTGRGAIQLWRAPTTAEIDAKIKEIVEKNSAEAEKVPEK
jgi:WD40 repeat protein